MKPFFPFVFGVRIRTFLLHLFIFFFFFGFPAMSNAQLSGSYTIGTGGDYATLAAAADDLHTQGVSGPVVFNVLSGTYEEQFVIGYIPGADSIHTVTFQSQSGDPANVTVQYAYENNDNYVVKLDSASYVTLKNITFRTTSNENNCDVVVFDHTAGDIVISGCVLEGKYYPYGDVYSRCLIKKNGAEPLRGITIENNRFYLGNYGVYLSGASNNKISGIEISGNRFDSVGYNSVYLYHTDAPEITRNVIKYSDLGVKLVYASGQAVVGNNVMSRMGRQSVVIMYSTATPGHELLVSNNMISTGYNTNSQWGIRLGHSGYINLYYNSVFVTNDGSTADWDIALDIEDCEGSSIEVVNNNLVMLHGGKVLLLKNSGNLKRCDYNNFLTPGNPFAEWDGTECADLQALKSASGDNAHSISAGPGFVSDDDLHVTSEVLNGAGVPVQGITEDIDGDTRDPLYPDIGADEFLGEKESFRECNDIPWEQFSYGAAKAVDYDKDGDMDIVLSGISEQNEYKMKLYKHANGDSFDAPVVIDDIWSSQFDAAAWGDFNNDGYPDLIITGREKMGGIQHNITRLYKGFTGSLTEISTDIISTNKGSVDWGDFDNDGDLDLLAGGNDTKVYRNDGPGEQNNWLFTDIITLPGSGQGSAKWGDYDHDGDLDIVISSMPQPYGVWLYRNKGEGEFEEVNAGIDSLGGRIVVCDYNNDGNPDLILAGETADHEPVTKIYRNEGAWNGMFKDVNAGLTGLMLGSISYCDYNGDGNTDILVTGKDINNVPRTILYKNMGNDRFEDSGISFPGVVDGSGEWGDFNRDGKQDLLLTGLQYDPEHPEISVHGYASVYLNETAGTNSSPSAPDNLSQVVNNTDVILTWSAASDQETPGKGLSYNIRIGTVPGSLDVMSPMAAVSGDLYIAETGNAGNCLNFPVKNLDQGRTYYWSVQAVDPSFAGSPFSEEMSFTTHAPYFEEAETSLPAKEAFDMAWVDYDSDGDLDLEITSEEFTGIYRNDETVFTNIDAVFYGYGFLIDTFTYVENLSTAWGDFDNDGTPDLLMAGIMLKDTVYYPKAKIYWNEGNGKFDDVSPNIFNLWNGDVSWVDYDNDGDLDVFITGEYGMGKSSKIYNNDFTYNGNGFIGDTNNVFIEGVSHGAVAWADYDKDGDMDLLLTGINNEGNSITKIYNNEGGIMRPSPTDNLPGVAYSSIDWGDCNGDGYPDILLSGVQLENEILVSYVTEILYNHQHGGFIPAELSPPLKSKGIVCKWNDVDNDGDLDIVFSGKKESGIYLNDNGTFTRIDRYFLVGDRMYLTLGDYDNDGGLDLFITGDVITDYLYQTYKTDCKLFHHKNTNPNHNPEPPLYLHAYYDPGSDSTMFMWSYGHDQETPREGLGYNLRIGTTPGGSEIMSAMADPATGFRQVVNEGNVGQDLSWRINGLTVGDTIYWSVQSLDNSLRGSPFAPEQSFIVAPTYNVTGDVYTSDRQPLSRAKVYVYSINQEGVPSESFIYSLNGTNHFSLSGVPAGEVTLRVMPDIVFYPDYAPAYLGNTIFYSEATRLNVDQNISGLEILVGKISALQGTINMEGSVSMAGGKGNVTLQVHRGKAAEAGTPVPDVPLYLLNNKEEIIVHAVTDSAGGFRIDSIPAGHYSFFADYKGLPMAGTNDSLLFDQENQSYEVSVIVGEKSIALAWENVTAVEEREVNAGISLYPNPVQDHLYLQFIECGGEEVRIRFIRMDGSLCKTVQAGTVAAHTTISLPVSDLPPGLYILSVEGRMVNYKSRIIKMRR